jgi:hypothetical protein
MKMKTACCVVALVLVLGCFAQEPKNIALGKPYTLRPAPNYGYCTDPGDAVQLTDGKYVEGYFWVQQGCVGWQGGGMGFITIDLGQISPISGLSYDTAAGVAGVYWPGAIIIFISDDGKAWHKVGDLVRMAPAGTLPEYGTYAQRKLVTNDLKTHGRYLQLAVDAGASYSFVDEIEVYEGPQELLGAAVAGPVLTDVAEQLKAEAFNNLLRLQFRRDLAAARKSLEGGGLSDEQRKALAAKADGLADKISDMAEVSPTGFRAVLPMTDVEREVFRFQAEVWRAQGKPTLRVWHANRWDYLGPSEEPPAKAEPAAMAVRMMNGETRADVINFTNADAADVKVRLRIEGLPGGANPGYVTVRQALHVGTKYFKAVAAALPEAKRKGGEWVLNVASGMTAQAWLEFKPKNVAAGRYRGSVAVTGAGQTVNVPLKLNISPIRFPERTRLMIGGWDYTDGTGAYGVKATNRDAIIALLREHHVNEPWATAAVMPPGKYDDAGKMTETPDTKRFDEWIGKWAGAPMYMVFVAAEESFAGAVIGTEDFKTRVGNWMHFWARHMRELGLKVGQLGFLIYDEPYDARGYRINAEWAKAVHAAEPELRMFVDPTPEKADGMEDMIAQMDILCPNRPQWLDMGWQDAYYGEELRKGKQLWFYSCSGPTRSFDPYTYYLLQAWHLAAIGGTGSHFWAFGDYGGASPWNDYVTAGAGPYCPLYMDDTSVTTAKWLEAIGESTEDFEYLVMLSDRVGANLESRGLMTERIQQVMDLLKSGPRRVLAATEKTNVSWDRKVDRDVADSVRGEVLDMLERL